jgi:NAD(P)-dependent dehydrogenase (short-subunit alcohol dehydrogenase family)
MDFSDERSVAQAADTVERDGEGLDVVIVCGGVLHSPDGLRPERRLSDVRVEHLVRSFSVNAIGPLLVAKHFERFLPRRDRCVFASLSARVGSIGDNRLGGWYGYRASKAAQNMFTKNLAIELRRTHRGLICVGLHPGTVDTALSAPFQRVVPSKRLFSAEQAATYLLHVIAGLNDPHNGSVLAWDGTEIEP